jgi:hypothetical protein
MDQNFPATNSTEASAVAPQPLTFVSDKPRYRTVSLEWPLQYGDRLITEIVVSRMTVAQLEAYLEAVRTGAKSIPDMLSFPDGEPVPEEVLTGLDADDDERLHEVMQSFLPQRLRQVLGQAQPTGGDTLPSSQAD